MPPELPQYTCLGLFKEHIKSIQAEEKEDLKRLDDQLGLKMLENFQGLSDLSNQI